MFRDKNSNKCYSPRGKSSGFHPERIRPHGMFKPLMSMSKESFMEMRKYFVLKILTDIPEGITGYQLQEEYYFPRTNVLRLLDRLEEEKLVETKEEIVEGRANKLYLITEEGIKQVEELKEKWGERFRMMSDTTMPYFTRGEKFHLMKKIGQLETSEDAIDYFRGMRSKIKAKQNSLNDRLKILSSIREELDSIIDMIEKDNEFNREKVVIHINEWWEKKAKNEEENDN